jgi:hypothetical protein
LDGGRFGLIAGSDWLILIGTGSAKEEDPGRDRLEMRALKHVANLAILRNR